MKRERRVISLWPSYEMQEVNCACLHTFLTIPLSALLLSISRVTEICKGRYILKTLIVTKSLYQCFLYFVFLFKISTTNYVKN